MDCIVSDVGNEFRLKILIYMDANDSKYNLVFTLNTGFTYVWMYLCTIHMHPHLHTRFYFIPQSTISVNIKLRELLNRWGISVLILDLCSHKSFRFISFPQILWPFRAWRIGFQMFLQCSCHFCVWYVSKQIQKCRCPMG